MNLMGGVFGRTFCGGASVGHFQNDPLSNALQQRGVGQRELLEEYDKRHQLICIHSNCPICQKEVKKQAKIDKIETEQQVKIAKKKKQDYDGRVRKWLEIIRKPK